MKKKILIFFIYFVFIYDTNAQTFNSQKLYLKIDTTQSLEKSTDWLNLGTKQERVYWYDYYPLLTGTQLKFWCQDRSQGQVLPLSTASNYDIKTLSELKAYFATLTQAQILHYLDNVKYYYIVEFIGNNQMEIVPVKFDMFVD